MMNYDISFGQGRKVKTGGGLYIGGKKGRGNHGQILLRKGKRRSSTMW